MAEKTIKEKLSVGAKWLRLLYMVLFGVIAWVLECIICLIAVFQFLFSLFAEKPLETLQPFSSSLSKYVMQIVTFLTYVSEEKPFPFTHWPKPGHEKPPIAQTPASKK